MTGGTDAGGLPPSARRPPTGARLCQDPAAHGRARGGRESDRPPQPLYRGRPAAALSSLFAGRRRTPRTPLPLRQPPLPSPVQALTELVRPSARFPEDDGGDPSSRDRSSQGALG